MFAFAANALLARATHSSAPDAWRRQAVFLLDGMRADAASRPLPADQPTQEEVRDALAHLGRS